MKRRLALTFAGSAALVLTAGSAAVAANLGILGAASEEPVGTLDANTVAELSTPVTTAEPIVVTVDEIVPVPVESVPSTAAPTGTDDGRRSDDDAVSRSGQPAGPAVTPSATPSDDDSRGDDDHRGDHDDHDDDGGHDEIEHEDD